jgi:hypothetical protein
MNSGPFEFESGVLATHTDVRKSHNANAESIVWFLKLIFLTTNAQNRIHKYSLRHSKRTEIEGEGAFQTDGFLGIRQLLARMLSGPEAVISSLGAQEKTN